MKKVHSSIKALNAYLSNIKPICRIKLSRLRERHAEAMGCNSYNHLVSLVKSNSLPDINNYDYLERLNKLLSDAHSTSLSDDDIDSIIDYIEASELQTIHLFLVDKSHMDIYFSDMMRCDYEMEPDCRYGDDFSNITAAIFNNETTLIYPTYELEHGYSLSPELAIMVSPSDETDLDSFYLGSTSAHPSLRKFVNSAIDDIMESAIAMIKSKQKEWQKKYCSVSFHIDEREIAYYSSSNNIVFIERVSFIFKEELDTEFVEAYKFVPSAIDRSIFTTKDDCDICFTEDDCDSAFQGHIAKGLYLDTIFRFDSKSLPSTYKEITPENFSKLMYNLGIRNVAANTLIGHNDGVSIIYGCTGFDNNNEAVACFQLFSYQADDRDVYTLFKSHGIDMQIVKEMEYGYSYQHLARLPHRDIESFIISAPEFFAKPFSASAIIYKSSNEFIHPYLKNDTTPASMAIDLFNEAITENEATFFGITILPPVPVPVSYMADPEMINKAINSINQSAIQKGMTDKKDIDREIVSYFKNKGYEFKDHLCVSFVTYQAIGDALDRLAWNILTVQRNLELVKHEQLTKEKTTQGFEGLLNPVDVHPEAKMIKQDSALLEKVTGMKNIVGMTHVFFDRHS